jgi:hypothetical protein
MWQFMYPLSSFLVVFIIELSTQEALIEPPSAGCASSVPGPPRLTIGVVFIAGIGCGLIFRYRLKFDDGQVAIILAFFYHQCLA